MRNKRVHRYWDEESAFIGGHLFSTAYWTVEVSFSQHTLGSFIIFSNRKCQSLTDLKPSEIKDLPIAIKKIEKILKDNISFRPNWFNYLQLGNKIKHLHIHGIPRYQSKRVLLGKVWKDVDFRSPPVWSKKVCKQSLVKKIRDQILHCL